MRRKKEADAWMESTHSAAGSRPRPLRHRHVGIHHVPRSGHRPDRPPVARSTQRHSTTPGSAMLRCSQSRRVTRRLRAEGRRPAACIPPPRPHPSWAEPFSYGSPVTAATPTTSTSCTIRRASATRMLRRPMRRRRHEQADPARVGGAVGASAATGRLRRSGLSWVVVAQVLSGVTWESAGATAEGPSSIRNPHGFAAPSA